MKFNESIEKIHRQRSSRALGYCIADSTGYGTAVE